MRADSALDPMAAGKGGRSAPMRFRRGASGRTVIILDGVLVIWAIGWVIIGVAISREVRNLSTLSDTVVQAGTAVAETGRALRSLDGLPFVGPRIAGFARQIDAAAVQAVRSGRESKESVQDLSVLLGFSVAVVPTVPILAMYVPYRISRVREVRAVRKAARLAGNDPVFQEYLARRAVANLPYHRLREVSPDPWRDLLSGNHFALAQAELKRLGVRRIRGGPGSA